MPAPTQETSSGGRVDILVVDDMPDSRTLLASLLKRHLPDVAVLHAANGEEALALAFARRFDLILLDVCMPGIDGFEVCAKLNANPSTSSTPILMLSGAMVESKYRCRGLDHGADGYICKPFQNEELIAQVRALLRAKQYRDQLAIHKVHLEEELTRRTSTLRDSEEQLRTLFEQSPDAVFVEDREGRVLAANAAACHLHGLTREQLVGSDSLDLVPKDAREATRKNNQRLLQGSMQHIEGQSLHANGKAVPVEIRASRIQFNGEPALLLHVRDITERKRAEEELRASEHKFSNLFQHSNDPIFLLDLDRNILDANNKALERFGYTHAEMTSLSVMALHPAHVPAGAVDKAFRDVINDRACRVDIDFVNKDGLIFPAEISASLLEIDGQRMVQGVVRDMTERRRAAKRQQATTTALRSVVEAADELMGCPDVRTVCRRAVELGRERLGLERCAIFRDEGERVRGTFGTNLDGETTDECDNVQEKGGFWPICFEPLDRRDAPCRVVVDRLGEWDGQENRHLHEGWVAMTPLEHEGQRPRAVFLNDTAISGEAPDPQKQEILAVYCSLLGQILERKQAEERYRSLVEQLPAITYCVELSETSRTVYISPQVDTLLGFTQEEWQADPDLWVQQLHPDDRDRVVSAIREADESGLPFLLDYRVLSRGGDELWFRNHAVYVRDEHGKPLSLHGVMLDITDRVQAEQRERELTARLAKAKRLESLGILAGGVAHDLNNVLGPLVAYPDLILAELDPDSPIKHDVDEISKSAKRAADIIQDLLSLARRGRYQREPVGLTDLTSTYLESPEFHALAERHPNVTVETDLKEDLPFIQGSSPHLIRLLANLVTNAMEAMPSGGRVELCTSVRHVDKQGADEDVLKTGDYAVVTISDTGEGIGEEDLERIFEPFYTKRKLGRSGTGIGLAVVYGVVRDLDGHVEVKSHLEKGTEFTLYFPLTSEVPCVSADVPSHIRGTESVLIIDDVKEQRDLAARMLTSLGYSVSSVENGHKALEYLKRHAVDLIVLDMIMDEDFDGLDTYREILRAHPAQRCIIVSGYAETARVRDAQALGAGMYLRKPYTADTFGQAVRRELDKQIAA